LEEDDEKDRLDTEKALVGPTQKPSGGLSRVMCAHNRAAWDARLSSGAGGRRFSLRSACPIETDGRHLRFLGCRSCTGIGCRRGNKSGHLPPDGGARRLRRQGKFRRAGGKKGFWGARVAAAPNGGDGAVPARKGKGTGVHSGAARTSEERIHGPQTGRCCCPVGAANQDRYLFK